MTAGFGAGECAQAEMPVGRGCSAMSFGSPQQGGGRGELWSAHLGARACTGRPRSEGFAGAVRIADPSCHDGPQDTRGIRNNCRAEHGDSGHRDGGSTCPSSNAQVGAVLPHRDSTPDGTAVPHRLRRHPLEGRLRGAPRPSGGGRGRGGEWESADGLVAGGVLGAVLSRGLGHSCRFGLRRAGRAPGDADARAPRNSPP